MQIRKNFFILFIFLLGLFNLYLYILTKSYSDFVFNNISNTFVRFHVVANSNTTEDQIIKYRIRDSIIEYLSPLLNNAQNKKEALDIINTHLTEIKSIASEIINTNGRNDPVNVYVGKSKFPTKEYDDYVLPEGVYDALKIEIGNAKGQNWWCVMFPSICFPEPNDISQEDRTEALLDNALNSEELSIISKNNISPDIKIKFKLIEIFENI